MYTYVYIEKVFGIYFDKYSDYFFPARFSKNTFKLCLSILKCFLCYGNRSHYASYWGKSN